MISDVEVKKNRKSLILMFSIGLVPVLVAYVVYVFFPQLLPTTTTNQGELISPSISHEQIGLTIEGHQWSLVVPLADNCNEGCEKLFYYARQVNVALGKETKRVKRIMVTTQSSDAALIRTLKKKYPDMDLFEVDKSHATNVFSDVVDNFFSGEYIFLMDPNGNIMMYYTTENAGHSMLKDIKFLLKVSNIG
ncbi:MAG: hypothetical protein JKY88_03580 [Pseudomonadales bacterium]|nr:hypothetical protein [Pseudomonadales bacterium]